MADNEDIGFGGMPFAPATPRDSIGSAGPSVSSGGSSMSTSGSSSSLSMKTALSDCSASWISYLNVLNNLCSAGTKLAHSISMLEQCGQSSTAADKFGRGFLEKTIAPNHPVKYLVNSWEDLARATAVATSTVKSHIMAVLQDFVAFNAAVEPSSSSICDMEQKRIREHNEMIILENAQTIVNIQHQFCAASYDAFSSLTCCLVCQSPVGFPHEQDCIIIKQKTNTEPRSQTPSPHFGGSYKIDQKPFSLLCSAPGQTADQLNFGLEQTRGISPQQNFRDIMPLQSIFENTRGPLPNPGHLLSMKTPFYRRARSPLNFPLFPLNGQRRWSEAAAAEVNDDNSSVDVEGQMRRWSMPWEASKTDQQNTVTWHQTRIMPLHAIKMTNAKFTGSERSNSNTPESVYQSSQDGLTEAIQLLSCRSTRNHPQTQTQAQTQVIQTPNSTQQPPSLASYNDNPTTFE